PLIYGYGDFPCAGNVTWVDEVKEHRNKESAKGGPEQITYTYTISYMVVVCKGEISGLKLVRRNGKIVYDARTDSELTALGYSSQDIAETRAAQANFQERATIYYGTQDQMPDPTMVAVKGAGNVPAYTGVAYIVMKDDETQQGEYAQFEFVVANCGERHEGVVIYTPVLWDQETATGGDGSVVGDGTVWVASTNTAGYVTADTNVSSGDWYWEHSCGWYRPSSSQINHFSGGGVIRLEDSANGLVMMQLSGGQPNGGVLASGGLFSNIDLDPDWVPATSNTLKSALVRNRLSFAGGQATWEIAIDGGAWVTVFSGETGTFSPYAVSRGTEQDGSISARRANIYSVPEDLLYEVPAGSLALGAAKSAPDPGVPIPDAPGYFINPDTGVITGPAGTQIDPCQPSLGEIVADQCDRRGVTSRDVSELTDQVGGYRIAKPSSSQANIQGLQPGYFFGASEFDGT